MVENPHAPLPKPERCRASDTADSPGFLSAATPFLGAAEIDQLGEGYQEFMGGGLLPEVRLC